MNLQTPPTPTMDPDRMQKKADILESNLFNAVSKAEDPVVLRFRVSRETYPDPVIIKALTQLFPRLNLKAPKILLTVRKLLLQTRENTFKIKKTLLDLSESGNPELAHLGITMRAQVAPDSLAVEIRGVPPIPGRDGAIDRAFFDYETCPGLLKADGAIDFREINKYPIVKAGDNLFFITPEVQGRSGMGYDGKVIPVQEVMPLRFNLRTGVELVESMGSDGMPRGHFIRATQTGVVVLTRAQGRIQEIEVRDALEVKRLDFSTGNIGTRFVCPVSMTIDTICAGFSIRARGMLEIKELEGGEIETDSHASVRSAHPGSRIKAREDILVHRSKHADITSSTGRIRVAEEMVDTRADAVGILFEKPRGIFSGNTLDAQQITLKKVYISGENTLYFGHGLFREKAALAESLKRLKAAGIKRTETQAQTMSDLQNEIKQLSGTLQAAPQLKENLRTFIMATRSMDFEVLFRELNLMEASLNTKEITRLKKLLTLLRKFPMETREAEQRDQAIRAEIARAEKAMTGMRLDIDGFLRRAATLKLFTPNQRDEAPALFIESRQDRDTHIKIQGRYTRDQGFVISEI